MKTATGDVPPIRARHAFAVVSALSICAAIAACKDNSSAPTTPDSINAEGPDTLVGVVGAALGTEVEVRVLDVNLRPVPNASVAFAVSPASGATLTPATEPTDDSGFARATVTLGTVAGMDTVTATIADAAPATVFLMVNGGAPSKVMADSGSQQTAAAGTPLPDSLVALVTDQYGNALANVTVTWSTTSFRDGGRHDHTDRREWSDREHLHIGSYGGHTNGPRAGLGVGPSHLHRGRPVSRAA